MSKIKIQIAHKKEKFSKGIQKLHNVCCLKLQTFERLPCRKIVVRVEPQEQKTEVGLSRADNNTGPNQYAL